jgi:ribosomal protein L37E
MPDVPITKGISTAITAKPGLAIRIFRACSKCGAANPKGKETCPQCGYGSTISSKIMRWMRSWL